MLRMRMITRRVVHAVRAVFSSKRQATLGGTTAAAFVLLAATTAWACIPWAGKLELSNINESGAENGTTVWGADHTDIDANGNTGEDRGNGQGMVWCDVDDADAGQPYKWAEVATQTGDDITLTVTGSDHECDSNVRLPEDNYSITFVEDSFNNEDDSTSMGEETFADSRDPAANGGSDEVAPSHCMDLDDDETNDEANGEQFDWNLIEDDDGRNGAERNDGDTTWFPVDGPNGNGNDVIDEGPHSISIDLDDLQPNPDPDESGTVGDDSHIDAAGICITSFLEFEHDNDDVDDDDSEVAGGNKDDDGSGDWKIEYGNAIPVNILSTV